MRILKPATAADVEMIHDAFEHVKKAVILLSQAGATKAADRVRTVVKSVEGARRHVLRRRAEYKMRSDLP